MIYSSVYAALARLRDRLGCSSLFGQEEAAVRSFPSHAAGSGATFPEWNHNSRQSGAAALRADNGIIDVRSRQ